MTDFFIKNKPYDLSFNAGLALVGKYLKAIKLPTLVDEQFPVRSGVANSDILKSYLGLLCLGKNDFDAIRGDDFFVRSLGLRAVPSSPTLRQRLGSQATNWFELSAQINQTVLGQRVNGQPIEFGALPCGYTPIDMDTFAAVWCLERDGKRPCVWSEILQIEGVGSEERPARRMYRLTELTIVNLGFCHKHGNALLLPYFEIEGRTTTLPERIAPHQVIALYQDHGTHEQFHSEFKTDMDLERLPSGKFDTNYLVCALAAVAMNILRLIGQHTLGGPDAPVRHLAKRRRIKTMLQEMMFKAARMIQHAGRWMLGLGANDSGFVGFERHYGQLLPRRRPGCA